MLVNNRTHVSYNTLTDEERDVLDFECDDPKILRVCLTDTQACILRIFANILCVCMLLWVVCVVYGAYRIATRGADCVSLEPSNPFLPLLGFVLSLCALVIVKINKL